MNNTIPLLVSSKTTYFQEEKATLDKIIALV